MRPWCPKRRGMSTSPDVSDYDPEAASRPTPPAHESLRHVADSILGLSDESLNALLNLAYRLRKLEKLPLPD